MNSGLPTHMEIDAQNNRQLEPVRCKRCNYLTTSTLPFCSKKVGVTDGKLRTTKIKKSIEPHHFTIKFTPNKKGLGPLPFKPNRWFN